MHPSYAATRARPGTGDEGRQAAAAGDVVLARELAEHAGNLFGLTAIGRTAELLAEVRPGGWFVLIGRQQADWSEPRPEHLRACFERHLRCFGDEVDVRFVPDRWWEGSTWRWLWGAQRRGGWIVACLHVPPTASPEIDWWTTAESRRFRSHGACCLWARQQHQHEAAVANEMPVRSKAAA